jgi:hypothetical protein
MYSRLHSPELQTRFANSEGRRKIAETFLVKEQDVVPTAFGPRRRDEGGGMRDEGVTARLE